MQKTVELIEPSGDGEQYLIDVDCRRRGLPPCEREWVCQHSCPPETIPDCQDMNCEGTTVVNSSCIAAVCGQAARGDFASFDAAQVRLRLQADAAVAAELNKAAQQASLVPGLAQEGTSYIASGSLLAFARFCARRIDEDISAASGVLGEIEQTLADQFYRAGAVLFRQRFCDLRSDRASRGNVILFLGSGVWPARAILGWEDSKKYNRLNPAPAVPEPNRGFGLHSKSGNDFALGPIDSGLNAVPGDLYGPQLRLEFRVDQDAAERVAALCMSQSSTVPSAELSGAMLSLLQVVTKELGLPVPQLPPASGDVENVCMQAARFMRRLMLEQPIC